MKWEPDHDPLDEDYYEAEVESKWLDTDTIATVEFAVDPASALSFSETGIQGAVVRVKITGGVAGTHPVKIKVTTNSGRIRYRTLYLTVKPQ